MATAIDAILTLRDAVKKRDRKIHRIIEIINDLDNTRTKKILIERLCDEGIAQKSNPEG